jgi:hypothetical protein
MKEGLTTEARFAGKRADESLIENADTNNRRVQGLSQPEAAEICLLLCQTLKFGLRIIGLHASA